MKHKTFVNYEGNMEELANEIANLRYDALRDFLDHLAAKLSEDSAADLKRGRKNLSNELQQATDSIIEAAWYISRAWKISEPFMKDKDGNS